MLGKWRTCPYCKVSHRDHLSHTCIETGRRWNPGDDERAAAEAARIEAERLKALQPKSRRGRPKAGKEASTVEARKPWVAMGISRPTWYRRLKRGEVSWFDDEL